MQRYACFDFNVHENLSELIILDIFQHRYGRLEVVDALLSGRNVRSINVKNSEGKTALHFACAEGHNRVAEHLLKLGAAVER